MARMKRKKMRLRYHGDIKKTIYTIVASLSVSVMTAVGPVVQSYSLLLDTIKIFRLPEMGQTRHLKNLALRSVCTTNNDKTRSERPFYSFVFYK